MIAVTLRSIDGKLRGVTGLEQQPLAAPAPADTGDLESGFVVGKYRIEGLALSSWLEPGRGGIAVGGAF